jgi:hypothetical protein
MTTGVVLILSLGYAAVAALLLNLNLATRHGPWIKGGAILVVSLLYAGTWYGTRSLLGWPSPDPVPEEFRVLWISMDEPDKSARTPGAIYFWLRELDEAGLPVGPPRAHRIPWDEASAEAAQDALERMEEGEALNGRLGRNLVDAATPAEEGARYAGDGTAAGEDGPRPDIEFVRVPPPTLPPKGPPARD